LQRAADRLAILRRETEDLYKRSVIIEKLCEVRNLITVAGLIIRMAQERKESRGLHFSIDYPKSSEKVEVYFNQESEL